MKVKLIHFGDHFHEQSTKKNKKSQVPKFHRFFTLRACPPTHLHAPYLYVPCTLAPCPASAMRMLTPWVGVGDQGTQRRGPRGGRGRRTGGRALRARTGGRARCARWGPSGPWAPWGGTGTAYTQQRLCQTEYIIPTNAIPYGIHTGGNQETFSLKFKEGFSAESGAFARP